MMAYEGVELLSLKPRVMGLRCLDPLLLQRRWRWRQEMMLAFKPAVKETPLRRINSGTEWCSTPSFKGSYHATCGLYPNL